MGQRQMVFLVGKTQALSRPGGLSRMKAPGARRSPQQTFVRLSRSRRMVRGYERLPHHASLPRITDTQAFADIQ
jgi:hypothetical protein